MFAAALCLVLLLAVVSAQNIGLCCRKGSGGNCGETGGSSRFLDIQYALLSQYADSTSRKVYWVPLVYDTRGSSTYDASIGEAIQLVLDLKISHLVATPQGQPMLEGIGDRNAAINFTVIDTSSVPFSPSIRNRTEMVSFREDQAGFAAGVLAGAHSANDHVAGVFGPRQVALKNFANGFIQGARLACPGCTIDVTFLGSFSRASLPTVIPAVQDFIDGGADVVFGCSGGLGSAIIRSVADPTFVIGVDGDEYYYTFQAGNVSQSKYLISSAIKRADIGALASVRNALEFGNPHTGTRLLSFANGGLSMAPCHDSCGYLSAKTQSVLSSFVDGLIRGTVDTGIDPTTGNMIFDDALLQPMKGELKATLDDLTFHPIRVGEAIVLLHSGNWRNQRWIDVSGRHIVQAQVKGNTTPPTDISNYAATGATLVDGWDIGLLFGGSTTTGSWDTRFYIFSFAQCFAVNLCQYLPYWEAIDTSSIIAARELHSMASNGSYFYILGGVGQDGLAKNDLWKGRVCGNSSFSNLRLNLTRLPDPPRGHPLEYGVHSHAATVWTAPAGGFADFAESVLVVAGGYRQTAAHQYQNHYISFFSLTRGEWIWRPGPDTLQSCLTKFTTPLPFPVLITLDDRLLLWGNSLLSYYPIGDRCKVADAMHPLSSGALWAPLTEAPEQPKLLSVEGELKATAGKTPFQTFFVLPVGATEFEASFFWNQPAIRCDETELLVLNDNGTYCVRCRENEIIRNHVCYPCDNCGSPTSVTLVVFVVLLCVVFVVGLIIGIGVRYAGRHKDPHRVGNAPRQVPCAIAVILVPNTTALWRTEPKAMGAALKIFHDELALLIARHQCYHVRTVGDAFFIVSDGGPQMMRLIIDVIRVMRNSAWPSGCSLEPAAALHWGSPTIVPTEIGLDYTGTDIDLAATLVTKAAAGEILVTAHASSKIELDMYVDASHIQRGDDDCYNDINNMLSVHFQRFKVPLAKPKDKRRHREAKSTETSNLPSVSPGATQVSAEGREKAIASVASTHSLVRENVFTQKECQAALELVCEAVSAMLAPLSFKEETSVSDLLVRAANRKALSPAGTPRMDADIGEAATPLRVNSVPIVDVASQVLELLDVVELKLISDKVKAKLRK